MNGKLRMIFMSGKSQGCEFSFVFSYLQNDDIFLQSGPTLSTYTEVFVWGVFVLPADEAASQNPPKPKTQHHGAYDQQDGTDHCGPRLLQQAGVT